MEAMNHDADIPGNQIPILKTLNYLVNAKKQTMRKLFAKKLMILAASLLLSLWGYGQANGDYRTTASGNWSDITKWQVYNGSWGAAAIAPGAADPVFIEASHTMTVDANVACKDLNLSTTGIIAIGANTLQLSGKLRAYTGAAPGTNSSSPAATSITTAIGGKLQFIGNTRAITTSGEWGANTRNYIAEFALNSGQTGTFSTAFKCGDVTIVSGTMVCNSDLRADYNTPGSGTVTVKSGATLQLANNSNVQRVATASSTSHIQSFVVEAGANLEFSGATVGVLGAGTITFDGTVLYTNSGAQTLLTKGANSGGADPNIYNNLTLQTSLKTLSQNTTVNGTLSMRTSTGNTPSLNLNIYTLTYGPSAILQYRGIGTPVPAQTTTDTEWPAAGSPSSMPPNVDIFNASTVTLNSSKSITGQLKLSGAAGINQKLILGNNNISVGSVYVPVPDAFKYVVTSGTGSLTINNVGATPVLFPVGPSTTLYHPSTITNSGTLDNFSVNVSSANPSCVTGAGYEWVNATWDITEGTPGGSNCAISLDYQGAATGAGFNSTLAQVFHCNGTLVDYHSTGTSVGTVVSGSAFSSFSPFGISSDAVIVLPVTILHFNGNRTVNGAALSWTVADEQNVKGYEVQRSADAINYTTIGFVKAGQSSYSFMDRLPVKGNNYYRLRVVDADGKSSLSKVVPLQFDDVTGDMKVYPTIVSDRLFVLRSSGQPVSYVVFNSFGQQVLSGQLVNAKEIVVSSLTTGNYILKVGDYTVKFSKL